MDDRGRRTVRARPSSAARAGGPAAAPTVVAAPIAAVVGGSAAVLAAPTFLTTVVTGGVRQPGFDQWSTFVSELGATGSPAAALTNLGFTAVGVCLGLFAIGMLLALPAHRTVGALLLVPAASFLVLAASPCSTGCPIALVDAGATPADAIHNAAATAGLIALALAAMTFAEQVPAGFAPSWYPRFSAAAGIAVAITGALFGAAVLARLDVGIAVAERAMLASAMAWNTVTGAALVARGCRSRR